MAGASLKPELLRATERSQVNRAVSAPIEGLVRGEFVLMKVTVEILTFAHGEEPKVVHAICHEAHSLEAVKATAQGVVDAPELPGQGYRIMRWAGAIRSALP